MRAAWVRFGYVAICLGLFEVSLAQRLPEGNNGIASRYPGDIGIERDIAVLFSDDFESYGSASELARRWDMVSHKANLAITTSPGETYAGSKAIAMSVPKRKSEVSNNLIRRLRPGRDVLFVRYYSKFDTGFDVLGSSHNGTSISSNYCCPGVRSDGYNKFLVSLEVGRDDARIPSPGKINIYIYHPDQRDIWGDHFYPTGRVVPFDLIPGTFGSEFVGRPDIIPELGRWYSYEAMLKVNTPGRSDGRVAVWLDGQLIADFPNLKLRNTTALKIDQFTLDLHVRNNNLGIAKKWYDNVVAATAYIGPMTSGVTSPRLFGQHMR